MHIGVVVVAVAIVLTGIFINQRKVKDSTDQTLNNQEVLSEKTVEQVTPGVTDDPSTTSLPNTPTNNPTIVATPTISSTNANVDNYRYPNSTVVNSTDNSLLLNSGDNSDTVTTWYKDKIKSEGMSVTSFVTTKTNDNVLNKLVGADGNREVRVEITKDSGSSTVQISVQVT